MLKSNTNQEINISEGIATEFTITTEQPTIGYWNIDPIDAFNFYHQILGNSTVEEKRQQQFNKDIPRSTKLLIKGKNDKDPKNIPKMLEIRSANNNESYKKEQGNHGLTALTYNNAFKLLTEEYGFSQIMADFTLISFNQGGFSGGMISGYYMLSTHGSKLLIELDENNMVTLKTSLAYDTNNSLEDAEAITQRKKIDLLFGHFPSKDDIFVNATVEIGKKDLEELPKSVETKLTLASSNKTGIEFIKECMEGIYNDKTQKTQTFETTPKDFKEARDTCIKTLAKFEDPLKIIETRPEELISHGLKDAKGNPHPAYASQIDINEENLKLCMKYYNENTVPLLRLITETYKTRSNVKPLETPPQQIVKNNSPKSPNHR